MDDSCTKVTEQLRVGQGEARRQYADYGVGAAIERDGATDDVGIAGKAAAPETFSKDDNIVAGLLFCRQEGAAENGPHAEQRKEIRSVWGDTDLLRLAAAARGTDSVPMAAKPWKDCACCRQ